MSKQATREEDEQRVGWLHSCFWKWSNWSSNMILVVFMRMTD